MKLRQMLLTARVESTRAGGSAADLFFAAGIGWLLGKAGIVLPGAECAQAEQAIERRRRVAEQAARFAVLADWLARRAADGVRVAELVRVAVQRWCVSRVISDPTRGPDVCIRVRPVGGVLVR